MPSRTLYPFAALAAACLLFGIAALPTATKHALHIQGALHPYLHIGAFALLTLLLLRSGRSAAWRVLCVIVLLGFGYATEAYESHLDGWPIERRDVWIDASGVLTGALAALLLERSRSQRSKLTF